MPTILNRRVRRELGRFSYTKTEIFHIFIVKYFFYFQPSGADCGGCGGPEPELKERFVSLILYFSAQKYQLFPSKICSNCSKPLSEVTRMVDKTVSTRDDHDQQNENCEMKSKTYLQLVREKKKRKKRKQRTKDKCSQTKERKATQTLAIVLGENFYRIYI